MFLKKVILIFFNLLLALPVVSANSVKLQIYLNTNQCVNCNIGLNALHLIHEKIEKIVYFPKSNQSVSEEMMEPYKLVKNLKLAYFNTVNNPFNVVKKTSYCLLYDASGKVDSFELRLLFSKVGTINGLLDIKEVKTLTLKNKIVLPDSLKFSDRISFFKHKNRLSICDYLTNKNVTLSFNATFTALNKAIQIKGSSFKPYPFLNSGIIDTALYRYHYDDIKFLGKTKPEINASYLTDSSLYLFLTFPCAITVNNQSGIGGAYFMYRKNLFTLKSELFAIPDDVLPVKKFEQEYFVININPFYIRDNKFYFTVYPDSTLKENYFLSEYEKTGNRVVYRSVINKTISDSTYLNTDFGNTQIFLSGSNSSFFYAQYQPIIIDIKSNTFINFKNILGADYEHKLLIRDVIEISNDEIGILVKYDGKEKKWVYNIKKNILVLDTRLNMANNLNKESLKFITPESLMAFDEANKHLFIYTIK